MSDWNILSFFFKECEHYPLWGKIIIEKVRTEFIHPILPVINACKFLFQNIQCLQKMFSLEVILGWITLLNNSRFRDDLHHIYPNELEDKDTTDTQKSASYLDLQLEIDNRGTLKTKLCDKCDDFTFPIVYFPFISTNIPE